MQPVTTDDRTALLIADYLEPDPTNPRVTAYRLRGSHLPVRQVAQHVAANAQDTRASAAELGVYYRAVDAALAHYAQHHDAFAQEATASVVNAAPQTGPLPRHVFPWWLQILALTCLGAVSMIIGVALAMATR